MKSNQWVNLMGENPHHYFASKGALLYGPPGCGKKLLAQAIARECDMGYVNVSVSELLEGHVRGSMTKIPQFFDEVRRAGPCVVVLDKLEYISQIEKSIKDSTARAQWTAARDVLLREIDKSDSNTDRRVFFIGVSTNPSLVEDSFIAKGSRRLEKIIYVPQPDLQARHRIIKLALGNSLVNFKLDILAKCTDKFSGADLVKLCSNARNRAITQFYDQAKE